jgi:hypothetical protein
MWGPDIPTVPPHTALYQFSLVALGFVSFGIFCKYALVPDRPATPRDYPFSGLITELGGLEENKVGENLRPFLYHAFTPRNRPERKTLARMNELALYIVLAKPFVSPYDVEPSKSACSRVTYESAL